jgi:hypothetical protein
MKTTVILMVPRKGKNIFSGYWVEGDTPRECFEAAKEAAIEEHGKGPVQDVAILAGHHAIGDPTSNSWDELDTSSLTFAMGFEYESIVDGSTEEVIITDKGVMPIGVGQGKVDWSAILADFSCIRQVELQDEFTYFQLELLRELSEEKGWGDESQIGNSGVTWGAFREAMRRPTVDFSVIFDDVEPLDTLDQEVEDELERHQVPFSYTMD